MNRSLIHIGLFIAILLLSLFSWRTNTPSANAIKATVTSDQPNTIINNMTAKRFAANGELTSILHSERVMYYPHNDESWLDNPKVIAQQQNNETPWTISAKRGKSQHNGNIITLLDQVVMHQEAGANNVERSLHTDELIYQHDDAIAKSSRAVTLTQPGLRIDAIGMVADIKQEDINLLQDVRARYETNT